LAHTDYCTLQRFKISGIVVACLLESSDVSKEGRVSVFRIKYYKNIEVRILNLMPCLIPFTAVIVTLCQRDAPFGPEARVIKGPNVE